MNEENKNIFIGVIGIIVILIAGGIFFLRKAGNSDSYTNNGNIGSTTNQVATSPVSQSTNIRVSSPQPGQHVGTPVVVSGEALVFERTVNYRLKDENGKVLAKGYTTATEADYAGKKFGTFRGEMVYTSETTGNGTVEVFSVDQKDGSEVDKVTIPVQYTKTPEFIKG